MPWNWQLPKWPHFQYDPKRIAEKEKQFLLKAGSSSAFLKKIEQLDEQQFVIEILSSEGQESSKIEGEILDRESLQSSIKRHFGLNTSIKPKHKKEEGVADLLYMVYQTYDKPLTHSMLWEWHKKLFPDSTKYRDHEEAMQVVSGRLDKHHVFFEAPPSKQMHSEMQRYIDWFNAPTQGVLGKTAIAHLYFENIHPFEDGNGRIGRALVEKSLSQAVGRPILIAVSKVLEKRKKEYYKELGACNRSLDANAWVEFFADCILQAQEESLHLLNFIIEKSRLLTKLGSKLNERQEKALLRMFREGPQGFQGGLSADKYIAITGASRATATRDLTDLVELGALTKTGALRHTRYWLNIK